MSICMATGEAAGIAAKMARDGGIPFSEVNVTVLREKIREHGGICGANEINE